MKRLLESVINKTISVLTPLLLWLLSRSYRIHVIRGGEHYTNAANPPNPGSFALALWHQDAFGSVLAHTFRNIVMLISHSRDGEITANAVEKLGYQTVRGGSSMGGKAAKDQLVERMQSESLCLGITVDGPRGPIFEVKPGIISIASATRIPIIPVTCYAPRSWVLKSWDKLRVPKPFSKIYIGYGEPMYVAAQLDSREFEEARQELGRRITDNKTKTQLFVDEECLGGTSLLHGNSIGEANSKGRLTRS